jgi:ATP-binding cassette subfamily C (CFTR/MRP) protein 1
MRDNILLDQPFDAVRYRAAVEAACLAPDVALMPAGDNTEIGEPSHRL